MRWQRFLLAFLLFSAGLDGQAIQEDTTACNYESAGGLARAGGGYHLRIVDFVGGNDICKHPNPDDPSEMVEIPLINQNYVNNGGFCRVEADPTASTETDGRESLCATQDVEGGYITGRRAPAGPAEAGSLGDGKGLKVNCNNGKWQYAAIYCSYVRALTLAESVKIEKLGRQWSVSKFPFTHHQERWEEAFQSLQYAVYDLSRAAPVEKSEYHVGHVHRDPQNDAKTTFEGQGNVLVKINGIIEEAQRVAEKVRNLARTAAIYKWDNLDDDILGVPGIARELVEGVTEVLVDAGAMSDPLQALFDQGLAEVEEFESQAWTNEWVEFLNSAFFYSKDGTPTVATVEENADNVKQAFAEQYNIDVSNIDIEKVETLSEYPDAIIVQIKTVIRQSEVDHYKELNDKQVEFWNEIAIELAPLMGWTWTEATGDAGNDLTSYQEDKMNGKKYVSKFEPEFTTLFEHYELTRHEFEGTERSHVVAGVCIILSIMLVGIIVLCVVGNGCMGIGKKGQKEEEGKLGNTYKPRKILTAEGGVSFEDEADDIDAHPEQAGDMYPGDWVEILDGPKRGRKGKLVKFLVKQSMWMVQISRKERGRVRTEKLRVVKRGEEGKQRDARQQGISMLVTPLENSGVDDAKVREARLLVNRARGEGYSDDDIYQFLGGQGYSKGVISEAIKYQGGTFA